MLNRPYDQFHVVFDLEWQTVRRGRRCWIDRCHGMPGSRRKNEECDEGADQRISRSTPYSRGYPLAKRRKLEESPARALVHHRQCFYYLCVSFVLLFFNSILVSGDTYLDTIETLSRLSSIRGSFFRSSTFGEAKLKAFFTLSSTL